VENRVKNLLCLHGVSGFKPRLKNAVERLEMLCGFAGGGCPKRSCGG
jgi:hypothetical protein